MPFDRQDVHDTLDPQKFVESLELDQVGFLAMYLKGSTNKKYYPLRVALEERLRTSPIQRGVGNLVARRFTKSHNNGDAP
jgi:hypothetical protein